MRISMVVLWILGLVAEFASIFDKNFAVLAAFLWAAPAGMCAGTCAFELFTKSSSHR